MTMIIAQAKKLILPDMSSSSCGEKPRGTQGYPQSLEEIIKAGQGDKSAEPGTVSSASRPICLSVS